MAYNSLHSRIDICYYEQMNIWVHKINFSWPGFSVQTAKVFPIFQKFSTWFLFSRTQALLAYSLPALYWIIGLSHYSLHPVPPWEDEEIQPWEKPFSAFTSRKKTFKSWKWKYAWVEVHDSLMAGNWTRTETGAFLPDWSQRSIDKRLRYHIEQDLSWKDRL